MYIRDDENELNPLKTSPYTKPCVSQYRFTCIFFYQDLKGKSL